MRLDRWTESEEEHPSGDRRVTTRLPAALPFPTQRICEFNDM